MNDGRFSPNPQGAGLIGSIKVQSTVIFVANFIRIRSGAEHRNLIILRCAAPYELYFDAYYKYFAALPLVKFRTNQPPRGSHLEVVKN